MPKTSSWLRAVVFVGLITSVAQPADANALAEFYPYVFYGLTPTDGLANDGVSFNTTIVQDFTSQSGNSQGYGAASATIDDTGIFGHAIVSVQPPLGIATASITADVIVTIINSSDVDRNYDAFFHYALNGGVYSDGQGLVRATWSVGFNNINGGLAPSALENQDIICATACDAFFDYNDYPYPVTLAADTIYQFEMLLDMKLDAAAPEPPTITIMSAAAILPFLKRYPARQKKKPPTGR